MQDEEQLKVWYIDKIKEGWDRWLDAVVIAKSEKRARELCNEERVGAQYCIDWENPELATCELIANSTTRTKEDVLKAHK